MTWRAQFRRVTPRGVVRADGTPRDVGVAVVRADVAAGRRGQAKAARRASRARRDVAAAADRLSEVPPCERPPRLGLEVALEPTRGRLVRELQRDHQRPGAVRDGGAGRTTVVPLESIDVPRDSSGRRSGGSGRGHCGECRRVVSRRAADMSTRRARASLSRSRSNPTMGKRRSRSLRPRPAGVVEHLSAYAPAAGSGETAFAWRVRWELAGLGRPSRSSREA